MEKPIAVIEITSSSIRLLVGYELGGQPYVLYSLEKPIGHIVEAGNFVDVVALSDAIKSLTEICDESMKLKIKITDCILVLPPYGLEIFQTQQVTTIVSDIGSIQNIDIRNIFALIRNGRVPTPNELIDIVPERFVLDQGRSFINPPINEVSQTLTMSAKVHTLPKNIFKYYQQIVEDCNINVSRTFVAPFAASELLAEYQEVPQDYFLVDIGSHVTTVSLIGGKQLYASRFFEWGGSKLDEKIAQAFNVSLVEAEKIKKTYGIDRQVMNFKVPLVKTTDGNGNETQHYVNELTTIVKAELDKFVIELNNAINALLANYRNNNIKALPMMLIGGGSQLNGLKEYLEPKVQSEYVKVVYPRSLGARDSAYINCLGVVVAHAKHQAVFDETHPRVNQVTRGAK